MVAKAAHGTRGQTAGGDRPAKGSPPVDLPGLIKALAREEPAEARQSAAVALGQTHDARAVEPLIGALHDVSPEVRRAAAMALGALGDLRAVEPLIRQWTELVPDQGADPATALGQGRRSSTPQGSIDRMDRSLWALLMAVGQALGKLGDERAIDPLLETLRHEDLLARWVASDALSAFRSARVVGPLLEAAVRELGRGRRRRCGFSPAGPSIGDALSHVGPAAVEPLIEALDQPSPEHRRLAARALGNLHDGRAVEPLIRVLQSGDQDVREVAVSALGKLGDARAVEALLGALEERCDAHSVAIALGEIGDPRAVEPLIRVLQEGGASTLHAAAEALGRIGDPRAIEPLIAVLGQDGGPLDRLLEDVVPTALAGMGLPAVEPLIAVLKSGSPDEVRGSAYALGKIGDVRAAEPLLVCLTDQTSSIRQAAARALGDLGAVLAMDPLIAALFDADPLVCQAAVEGLGNCADRRAILPLQQAMQRTNSTEVRRCGLVSLVQIRERHPTAIEPAPGSRLLPPP